MAKYPVDIDKGNEFVRLIKPFVKSTENEFTLNSIGPFAGLFSLGCIGEHDYSLVASMDGVGTITKIFNLTFNDYDLVGQSLVNHCVNDILTVGAKPLFFLDYVAASQFDPIRMSYVVKGLSKAASEHNCVVLGGETAEMPRIYCDYQYDFVGCIVGIVDSNKIITGKSIEAGDILIGLPSNGLHTNGYSLVNKLIADGKLELYSSPDESAVLYNELVKLHKSYFNCVEPMLNLKLIEGIAHITGGGLDNILRIIPDGMRVAIKSNSWFIPPVFKKIQEAGQVELEEMFRIYNMGIGMVLIVKPRNLKHFIRYFKGCWNMIGTVEYGEKKWEFVS